MGFLNLLLKKGRIMKNFIREQTLMIWIFRNLCKKEKPRFEKNIFLRNKLDNILSKVLSLSVGMSHKKSSQK